MTRSALVVTLHNRRCANKLCAYAYYRCCLLNAILTLLRICQVFWNEIAHCYPEEARLRIGVPLAASWALLLNFGIGLSDALLQGVTVTLELFPFPGTETGQ